MMVEHSLVSRVPDSDQSPPTRRACSNWSATDRRLVSDYTNSRKLVAMVAEFGKLQTKSVAERSQRSRKLYDTGA